MKKWEQLWMFLLFCHPHNGIWKAKPHYWQRWLIYNGARVISHLSGTIWPRKHQCIEAKITQVNHTFGPATTNAKTLHLMLLTLLALLFNLLLFLQLLCNSGFTQWLVFWSFVRIAVECRLQRRVSAHTRNHIPPQLHTTHATHSHTLQH